MPSISIALPDHFQLQSPLVRLPAEIKHMIYSYCFAAEGPIVDPVVGASRIRVEATPNLGIALLQTCRRIYHEADRRPLFSQNTFRFTCVDRTRAFFRSLGDRYASLVVDVEIDAKRVHSDHPGIGREWLHYLAWGGGTWAKNLGSLREDAPGLKCLRLNFQSWPSMPMARAELWNLLRDMLLHVRGLKRIVVIGASKGSGMAIREPWSPVHYVGGDRVGTNDLIDRMWRAVGEESEDDTKKIIRWNRSNGNICLEVLSKAYLAREVERSWTGPSVRKSYKEPWPVNGSCTWVAYQYRDSDTPPQPIRKGLNPTDPE